MMNIRRELIKVLCQLGFMTSVVWFYVNGQELPFFWLFLVWIAALVTLSPRGYDDDLTEDEGGGGG
jgi:hypothetical protein